MANACSAYGYTFEQAAFEIPAILVGFLIAETARYNGKTVGRRANPEEVMADKESGE